MAEALALIPSDFSDVKSVRWPPCFPFPWDDLRDALLPPPTGRDLRLGQLPSEG